MSKDSSVRGCIVIVMNPILRTAQVQLLLPNVLPKILQNVAIELSIDGLVIVVWGTSLFLMQNIVCVGEKKNEEHVLD